MRCVPARAAHSENFAHLRFVARVAGPPTENPTPTFSRPAHLARCIPPHATTAARICEEPFTPSCWWLRADRSSFIFVPVEWDEVRVVLAASRSSHFAPPSFFHHSRRLPRHQFRIASMMSLLVARAFLWRQRAYSARTSSSPLLMSLRGRPRSTRTRTRPTCLSWRPAALPHAGRCSHGRGQGGRHSRRGARYRRGGVK